MRNLYKFLFVILILTTSCKRELDLTFGTTPDERMNALQKEYKQELVSAEYGWKVLNETYSKGNYGYYMDFDVNGKDRVRMVSDINTNSSTQLQESAYRVKIVNAPMLSFETYNYLHLLNDPNPGVMGGTAGRGLQADIEFDFKRSNGDTVFLKGRKNGTQMILVKATKEEQELYLNGGYLAAINKVKQIFANNMVSTFELNDVTYQIVPVVSNKRIQVIGKVNNKIQITDQAFSFAIDGLEIPRGLKVGNKLINKLLMLGDKFYAITQSGEKIAVNGTSTPPIPINEMMGVGYKGLIINYPNINLGTSTAGAALIQRFWTHGTVVTNPPYFNIFMKIDWDTYNKKIKLTGNITNMYSDYPSIITYDYTFDPATGYYKLSNRSLYDQYNVRAWRYLDQMENFFLNSQFKLDYHVEGGNIYGKITGVERPDVAMTFVLY
ncbi:DUF4302 domain-containing protein [Solitalea lacus]|uniref:DUF4302 domain-containing protein n=1 Tax=Solitalea lacus TaxID=2911172 RepID=UPI001EDB790D|nr:DUF4302 domain-containing protein [Solitalea lacus]UKJ09250.1 DUF4302 domain-containing protein [Solitalea lacus]